jgi:hypothetical protein
LVAHQGQPSTRIVAHSSGAGDCDLAGRLSGHQSIVPIDAAARMLRRIAPSQETVRAEYFERRKTMTYPTVDDLPEEATATLLGVCAQLSQSRHPGLARWAVSVSNALLVRLVSVTTGVHVDGTTTEPRQPLAKLDAKAAAIEAEERRLACLARPALALRTVLPSPAV